ncbi:Arylesterase precursor [Polystyrenella longa]|uniref:Arylesterase n=1 Tax=Polystyrenella longa TaxID=2528007 RepID=A0A518CJ87_9PLAN|nr:GDSL-type esterase/lipase family protein [Polystyrenella longa]QDU79293.1 Arylesterase precursor [Polystyrenella longa]
MPLAVCAVIVLIKNVDWPPAIFLLAAVMLGVGFGRFILFRKQSPQHSSPLIKGMSTIALWGAWLVFTWSWLASAQSSTTPQLDGQRPVVCVGDSLTAFGYPEELGKLLSIPVINQGMDGITSGDALKDLPKLIDENPQIVVIELGGHDFLKGKTRAATKANLQKIVDACEEIGGAVIIMEVPRGFIVDPFGGLERELVRDNDLELVSDGVIRNLVLWSPFAPPGSLFASDQHLSNDGLHPNSQGNQYMAESIANVFTGWYGETIRAKP